MEQVRENRNVSDWNRVERVQGKHKFKSILYDRKKWYGYDKNWNGSDF